MRKISEKRNKKGQQWLPVCGLLLLSLLWAVGWVRADLAPGSGAGLRLDPLCGEAVVLGLFAGPAAVVGAILKKRWPGRTSAMKALLVGVGLFVVPAVVGVLVQDRMDDSTRVALFSLTPLFAVIFEPHCGMDGAAEIRGGFVAAMIAIAGTFLVFPFELPHTYAAVGALLAVVVAAASVAAGNCLGVEIVQKRGACALTFGAVSAGSAAVLLGIAGLVDRRYGGSSAGLNAWAVSGVLALGLLFWLMRQMSAVQMTTRFLIAPLMANVMSLGLLRPHVEVQAWIGLLLIAGGAGWMVLAPRVSDNPDMTALGFR